MKRFAKHLLPLCMMLTVAAAPGASFAAQPDSGSDQRDTGTYQHFSEWMNQGQRSLGQNGSGQCGLGQKGGCNSGDLSSHLNLYPGQWSQCGSISPDRPGGPGCSGSNNCSNGSDCTGGADCPNGNDCSGGSGCPNQPGNQDKPEKPEQPNLPGNQDKPEKPQQPNQPGDQEKPEKPGTENPEGNIGAYQSQVVSLVNQERAKQGLSPLKINAKLSDVATKKAEDMRDKGYFSHTSPTYGSPFDMMKQFGIRYSSAGENIAKGQKTPEAVMNGWMNSQGHRDNILNSSYTEIGVGYVTDGSGNTYWVQMFIRP